MYQKPNWNDGSMNSLVWTANLVPDPKKILYAPPVFTQHDASKHKLLSLQYRSVLKTAEYSAVCFLSFVLFKDVYRNFKKRKNILFRTSITIQRGSRKSCRSSSSWQTQWTQEQHWVFNSGLSFHLGNSVVYDDFKILNFSSTQTLKVLVIFWIKVIFRKTEQNLKPNC